MNEIENIELRSEKVRNIIGKLPPRLIRIGTSIIFIIILFLLIGAHYFEYEYIIKTTAIIQKEDNITHINLYIPANEIDKVDIGLDVILSFEGISNMYSERVLLMLANIPDEVKITDNTGYFVSQIKNEGDLVTLDSRKISISDKIKVDAQIIGKRVNVIERIIEPFLNIINQE